MDWFTLLFILGGFGGLVLGGDWLVEGASQLAKTLGVPSLIIGLTIVAFGTSTPELAVSLQAALNGNADIAIANVVGSNIFNILFILGISSIITPLVIHAQIIKRELPLLILISFLFVGFSFNNQISRAEGIILFSLALIYTAWLVFEARQHKKQNKELASEIETELKEHSKDYEPNSFVKSYIKPLIWVAIGIVAITKGADWLVIGATQIATYFNISEAIVGVTIVAIGTSLPEVAASVMASLKGERDLAVGNVVGSNLYNILAIIGISGIVVEGGIQVSKELLTYHYPVMIGACLLCLPFFRPNQTMKRPVGALFLLGYLGYAAFLIYQTI